MSHQKVGFYFRSDSYGDTRRVSVVVDDYPFKPSVGDNIEIPIHPPGHPNHFTDGTISSVTHHPMEHYFKDPSTPPVTCGIELPVAVFDYVYEFLRARINGRGLTHQWENWDARPA